MKSGFYLKILSAVICFLIVSVVVFPCGERAFAMPFYRLKPQFLVLRAEFSTEYSNSSEERKHNIMLAAKSLDKTLIDVNGEFSFNRTVGKRTEKRGYKSAKIIVHGEFVEGVGGGVCQVSTTLSNAALLAGLKITECHPHSLVVNYVAPSFDAMVNSGSADLKFVNDTDNPVILRARADGNRITVSVYGEPMRETYIRKSVVKEEIRGEYIVLKDEKNEYPDLVQGEKRVKTYAKNGKVSEGMLIKIVNGKTVSVKTVRRDRYAAVKGVIIEGTATEIVLSEKPEAA